ncbi:MAG: SpoIIE family protein phosphatase [Candidatus Cloacimonetes bacterium]|nr:SpoIIE family protein phosphatase [Candidatus Cloacimonadota bacterium]
MVSIIIPLCFVYAITLYFSYMNNRKQAEYQARRYLKELTSHYVGIINAELNTVMQNTDALADIGRIYGLADTLKLKQFLHDNVMQNKAISGLAFAFAPAPASGGLYCPYCYRTDGRIYTQDVANAYDYSTKEWFTEPRDRRIALWSEPYLGKASGILNATYSVPVFRDARFYGIAVADISLPDLTRQIQTLKIHGGFIYMESKLNTIIAHPDQSLILSKSTKLENSEDLWVEKQAIESTGWNLVANVSEKAALRDVLKQLRLQLYLLIGSLASIIALITGVGFGITKPLRKLTKGAKRISKGEFDIQFSDINTRDEIKDLAENFQLMAENIKAKMKEISFLAEAKAKVEHELTIARQIQESLLPHVFPPFPHRAEFTLFAQMIPARDVAGDFYDFFFLDKNKLVLIIADVSGKGIPAALFMAVTRTLLKTVIDNDNSPSEVMNKANKILCVDNDNCMFTTLFIAVYDVDTGDICYANAGHLAPILFKTDGSYVLLPLLGDPALGVVPEHQYRQSCARLEIGEKIIFYTDGVTEAMNQEGQMYGIQSFIELIQTTLDTPASQMLKTVQDDLILFQNNDLADDITILYFGRKQ